MHTPIVEIVALSRRAESSPWGKCTEEAKTSLPPDVKADLEEAARASGKTVSEFVRDQLLLALYGEEYCLKVMRDRLIGRPRKGRPGGQ